MTEHGVLQSGNARRSVQILTPAARPVVPRATDKEESYMETTTLMIDLKANEINGLMALCRHSQCSNLAQFCESQEQTEALRSALDEICWQLASAGHEGAIAVLSKLAVR
ncbi:MAG: hypothetical protein KDI34_03115 [Halioglobus sp.]|nr:hypothetical protein [Halioglobus sp.]